MSDKPETIDEYLTRLDSDKKAALQQLREMIRSAAPDAEECISYQQPAFRQTRMLVGFGATKKHCAFYLMSNTVLDTFPDEIKDLDTSQGTIRFQPGNPLSESLVHRLVEARLEENRAADARKRQ